MVVVFVLRLFQLRRRRWRLCFMVVQRCVIRGRISRSVLGRSHCLIRRNVVSYRHALGVLCLGREPHHDHTMHRHCHHNSVAGRDRSAGSARLMQPDVTARHLAHVRRVAEGSHVETDRRWRWVVAVQKEKDLFAVLKRPGPDLHSSDGVDQRSRHRKRILRKNGPFIGVFPYVCPEPVLVK